MMRRLSTGIQELRLQHRRQSEHLEEQPREWGAATSREGNASETKFQRYGQRTQMNTEHSPRRADETLHLWSRSGKNPGKPPRGPTKLCTFGVEVEKTSPTSKIQQNFDTKFEKNSSQCRKHRQILQFSSLVLPKFNQILSEFHTNAAKCIRKTSQKLDEG